MSFGAIINVAAYLMAYFFRFQLMTKLAKSDEKNTTMRYFVEEQMIASPLLLAALGTMAAIGAGNEMMGFRLGFTTFLASEAAVFALLVGLCYAGLCICTTFIFLDCRENTFCVSMHCGSSMLSGVTAAGALTLFFNQSAPSTAQIASAGLIVIALLLLSPLHHFLRTLNKFNDSLANLYRMFAGFVKGLGKREPFADVRLQPVMAENIPVIRRDATDQEISDELRQLFLFVCSGNTCRSPMAAAIGNAEIAERLQIPFEALDKAQAQALSAGVAARTGAPMTPEAQQVLRLVNVPIVHHTAQNLTAELAHQANVIFCMTRAHREAVINMIPSVAEKTHCLDPEADIEDPIGRGLEAYLKCATHLHRLISWRLDEAQLKASL
jgi:protein-tyrosine-phosphatase